MAAADCLFLQLLLDLRPNEEHAQQWIVKSHTSVAVQAAPDMSEHDVSGVACHSSLLGPNPSRVPAWVPATHSTRWNVLALVCAGQHDGGGAGEQQHGPP